MELILQRISTGHSDSTVGVILYTDYPRWVTLEPPWKNNEPKVSCVPEGRYVAKRRFDSSKATVTWELQDVPGRSHILCGHVGNRVEDTEGCILFGDKFGRQYDRNYIYNSKAAYVDFVKTMYDVPEFYLTIRNLCATS